MATHIPPAKAPVFTHHKNEKLIAVVKRIKEWERIEAEANAVRVS